MAAFTTLYIPTAVQTKLRDIFVTIVGHTDCSPIQYRLNVHLLHFLAKVTKNLKEANAFLVVFQPAPPILEMQALFNQSPVAKWDIIQTRQLAEEASTY